MKKYFSSTNIIFLLAMLTAESALSVQCFAEEIIIPFSKTGNVCEIKSFPGIAAKFSGDGSMILVEDEPNKTLRIFDTKTWNEIHILQGDSGEFSRRGKIFLSKTTKTKSNWSGTSFYYPTTLYETVSWRKIRSFPVSASVSPDEKTGIDNDFHSQSFTLYDLQTGREIKTFSATSVNFHPDSKIVAIGNYNTMKTVLYDTETWKEILSFGASAGIFHPDGKKILLTGAKLVLCDTISGEEIWTIPGNYYAGFSPGGKMVSTYNYQTRDNIILDAATGKKIKTFKKANPIFSFGPDDGIAAAVYGETKKIVLYDTVHWKELGSFTGTSAAFNPTTQVMTVGNRITSQIKVFDISAMGLTTISSALEKGEFETTREYEERVNRWEHPYAINIVPGKYDADRNGFEAAFLETSLIISIPRDKARDIATRKESLRLEGRLKVYTPGYFVFADAVAVDVATGQKYAVSQQALKSPAGAYMPKPIHPQSLPEDIRKVPDFHSPDRPNDLAVVIGIERYQSLPNSDYSQNDAALVKDYLKALGFPERNIELIINEKATKSSLEKSLEAWLPNRIKKDSRVFVYYSGHGAPDPAKGEAYIVPYDGDPNYLSVTGYSLRRLYEKLGSLRAAEVVVVLDSCFSGAGGRSLLAKGARPLVMSISALPLTPNMAILTATQGAQISSSSSEKGHGIFTYYFLKALKEGKNNVVDIYEYLKPQVEDDAKAINVQQSPGIQPAPEKLAGKFILRK